MSEEHEGEIVTLPRVASLESVTITIGGVEITPWRDDGSEIRFDEGALAEGYSEGVERAHEDASADGEDIIGLALGRGGEDE